MIQLNQNRFIEDLNLLSDWADKFQYFVEKGEKLPTECPATLLKYKFEFCQSKTCFHAENHNGKIKIYGWSNSAVMAGIIAVIQEIFFNQNVSELKECNIFFHTDSGLMENLTPLRQQSLEKMVAEIQKLA